MRLVLNPGYGGFCLSEKVVAYFAARGRVVDSYSRDIARDDPLLIEAIDAGLDTSLVVDETDDSRPWYIKEYDGSERIVYFSPKNRGVLLLHPPAEDFHP